MLGRLRRDLLGDLLERLQGVGVFLFADRRRDDDDQEQER